MSQQAFVDFFNDYLDSPAGEAARGKLAGITDHSRYAEKLVELGGGAGFKFTFDEVMSVMEASEAKARAAANSELTEDDLKGVVGGVTTSVSTFTVKLNTLTLGSTRNISGLKLDTASYSTVMCAW